MQSGATAFERFLFIPDSNPKWTDVLVQALQPHGPLVVQRGKGYAPLNHSLACWDDVKPPMMMMVVMMRMSMRMRMMMMMMIMMIMLMMM